MEDDGHEPKWELEDETDLGRKVQCQSHYTGTRRLQHSVILRRLRDKGYRLGVPGIVVRFPAVFSLPKPSRPDLGPILSPIQWVPGTLSPEVKRPGSDNDHSLPCRAKVTN